MPESIVQVTEGSGKKLHTFQKTIGANVVEDEVVVLGEAYLADYFVDAAAAISAATANSHLMQIMAGATLNVYIRRIQIWQLGLAATAAIADMGVFRLTTAGTGGTAITPARLDLTDAASGATAMTLPTVKGTEAVAPSWHGSAGFVQTVPTSGVNPLLLDLDFSRLRQKSLRIAAGTANGIAVKNITAIAAATVFVHIELMEANF